LTPTIVKELFKGKPVYNYLKKNPMNMRPQGHDIISFWLFNTVVKSQLHYKMKPWNDCFINGWMLDPKGKKMSKSKNNIIEPQEMIEKYSADALRFMAGSCKLGEDLPFPEKELVAGQKTITKLWNASKFVFMHLKDFNLKKPKKLEVIDEWMLSKVNNLVKVCTEGFENYEYSKAKAEIDKFFWHVFCNNYLEIVKDRLYNPDRRGGDAKRSAQYVLYHSLLVILKIFAPIMPFITEEVYNIYYSKKEKEKSVHISSWPKYDMNLKINEKIGDEFIEILNEVRKYKSRENKSLKESITLTITNKKLESVVKDLEAVTHAKITFGKKFKIGD
jgi:valyl-tRNA synthetase